MADDPFVLSPEVWFAVLCNGLGLNPGTGHIDLQGVFNQARFFRPPTETGIPPHARVDGFLALGFTGGQGRFATHIEVRDIDGGVYWQRPSGDWVFEVGIGSRPAAFLGEQFTLWLPRPGRFFFDVHLTPGHLGLRIPLEVADQIGPMVIQPQPPGEEPA